MHAVTSPPPPLYKALWVCKCGRHFDKRQTYSEPKKQYQHRKNVLSQIAGPKEYIKVIF